MTSKRDFVAEIKARHARGRWHPTSAPLRLTHIRFALEAVPEEEDELLRYFPIALVATIEGFFREAITALVDAGPPFLDNLLRSPFGKEQRFDLSILAAVAGRQVTVGELVANLLPLKSLRQVGGTITSICGSDFLSDVRTVYDRAAVEIDGSPPSPILSDPDAILADVTAAFEYRHIYAHELADSHPLARKQASSFLTSVSQFLTASAEVISNTVYPNSPLTQAAMTDAARVDYDNTNRELTSVFAQLLATVDAERASMFRAAQDAWLVFRDHHGRCEGSFGAGGSIEPMLTYGALRATTERRVAELRDSLRFESIVR